MKRRGLTYDVLFHIQYTVKSPFAALLCSVTFFIVYLTNYPGKVQLFVKECMYSGQIIPFWDYVFIDCCYDFKPFFFLAFPAEYCVNMKRNWAEKEKKFCKCCLLFDMYFTCIILHLASLWRALSWTMTAVVLLCLLLIIICTISYLQMWKFVFIMLETFLEELSDWFGHI